MWLWPPQSFQKARTKIQQQRGPQWVDLLAHAPKDRAVSSNDLTINPLTRLGPLYVATKTPTVESKNYQASARRAQ